MNDEDTDADSEEEQDIIEFYNNDYDSDDDDSNYSAHSPNSSKITNLSFDTIGDDNNNSFITCSNIIDNDFFADRNNVEANNDRGHQSEIEEH